MKLLRLWRRSDSFKMTVILLGLALFLIGYCIRAAADYAVILRTPTEYICTAPEGFDTILPRLTQIEGIIGYSRQTTAVLMQDDQTLTVIYLSAAYLSDCYGIAQPDRSIPANDAAYASFGGEDAAEPLQIRGTLNGEPFSAEMIRTDSLPQNAPYAVYAVSAAELHDASELRICMNEPDPAALEQLGVHIINPEVQLAAEYEKKLVLLRIRFSLLAALLSFLAAGRQAAVPPSIDLKAGSARGY